MIDLKIAIPILYKQIIIAIILLVVFISLLPGCKAQNAILATDDFETDTLNKIWTNDKFIPGALNMQSHHVRTGKKAATLTLHQGDQIDQEKGTKFERAELIESKILNSSENLNYEYSFSLFLPDNFPNVPTRLVIAQWKQKCSLGDCVPNNPLIAVRYVSGELFITLQTGIESERVVMYKISENLLNKWNDFKFQIRFSEKQNGRLIVWLNEKKVVNFSGMTAYPIANSTGYKDPKVFYFKFGLYRDTMPQPMTIGIDNYKKSQLQKL